MIASISLTDVQIESVADSLRRCGFEFGDDFDDNQFALVIEAVLDGLGIELPE
jgi:hypothetical protein